MSTSSGERLSDRVLRAPMTRRRALAMTGGIAAAAQLGSGAAAQPAVATGWPGEMPDYATLAAAVQGEAARWNIPGMTAAVLHNGERTATATG
jgi:hypothetical protein